jgi:hypothetical protein
MERKIMYRGYVIEENPYHILQHEWLFAHEEYDGPEDPRIGSERSVEMCKQRIDQLEDEQ